MRRIVIIMVGIWLLTACSSNNRSQDTDSPGYYEKGAALYARKDFIGAVNELERAIAGKDHVLESRILLGNLYLEWGRFDESEYNYKKALKLDRYSIDALTGLAKIDIKNDQIAEALKALKEIIELDGHAVEAIFLSGALYLGRNEIDKAADCFRSVLDIDPHHTGAQLKLRDIMEMHPDPSSSAGLGEKVRITRGEMAQYVADTFNLNPMPGFTDDDMIDIKKHAAQQAIITVVSKGIMSSNNSRFEPDAFVTRGDLALIGSNLFAFKANDSSLRDGFASVSSPYLDVTKDQECYSAVIMLTTFGVFEPVASKLFEPFRYVSGREVLDFFIKLQALF